MASGTALRRSPRCLNRTLGRRAPLDEAFSRFREAVKFETAGVIPGNPFASGAVEPAIHQADELSCKVETAQSSQDYAECVSRCLSTIKCLNAAVKSMCRAPLQDGDVINAGSYQFDLFNAVAMLVSHDGALVEHLPADDLEVVNSIMTMQRAVRGDISTLCEESSSPVCFKKAAVAAVKRVFQRLEAQLVMCLHGDHNLTYAISALTHLEKQQRPVVRDRDVEIVANLVNEVIFTDNALFDTGFGPDFYLFIFKFLAAIYTFGQDAQREWAEFLGKSIYVLGGDAKPWATYAERANNTGDDGVPDSIKSGRQPPCWAAPLSIAEVAATAIDLVQNPAKFVPSRPQRI